MPNVISLIGKVRDMVISNPNKQSTSISIPKIKDVKDEMDKAKDLWKKIYTDDAPWLSDKVQSLGLGAILAAEVSRLITLEIKSEIADDEELSALYNEEVIRDLRTQVEYGLALGGIIFKPYVVGSDIEVDYCQPSDYTIVEMSKSGVIYKIFFKDYYTYKGSKYLRLEYHEFDKPTSTYTIANRVNELDDQGEIKKEIHDFSYIDKWAHLIPELTLNDIQKPLFGYFRPAVSNNRDTKSRQGVSILSRAASNDGGIIRRADIQLSRLDREYRMKAARQYVSDLAVKGSKVDDLDLDFIIKIKSGNDLFFESYHPPIYSKEYLDGLDEYKREIEDSIGLAHGTISTAPSRILTATEIRQTRHRTAVLISENQRALQAALEGVAYALAVWQQYPTRPDLPEVITEFDESSWSTWDEEVKSMQEDVASGLIKPHLYIMRRYKVTEEEAIDMMPRSEQLLTDNN